MAQGLDAPTLLRPVSIIRNRDEALSLLLPKFLGALWELGEPDEFPGSVTARVSPELEIGGIPNGHFVLVAHAYTKIAKKSVKVFSVHLAVAGEGNSEFFRYWGGQCGLLSWHRGAWEDVIVGLPTPAMTIAQFSATGPVRAIH